MSAGESENRGRKALTCIHDAYTLAAAPEEALGEADEIAVKHFIKTLAEIALAVASRKQAGGDDQADESGCPPARLVRLPGGRPFA